MLPHQLESVLTGQQPATGRTGHQTDHEQKWSAHHLAVPLQRSHLPAGAMVYMAFKRRRWL
jgi:hypothetical protein